ncbi:PadR family transcriptional regulator [Edaphobacter bradus]|uniref:PadR family transcriptional regulator n=1 Tax=Edaphobacter bradus TaxID=2259016 RepID=UPI0021DFF768|nr:PadR family transcriptional regulator [Edaphobacter bradus]
MAHTIRLSAQTRILLSALLERASQWRYGYDLSRETGLKAGTLYPILMRLSDAEWLETRWEESSVPGRPPRHMYRLTQDGRSGARAATKDASVPARLTRPICNEV